MARLSSRPRAVSKFRVKRKFPHLGATLGAIKELSFCQSMALEPDAPVVQHTDASYRCPGCGELVDSRRLQDVLVHHQHVLHPPPAQYWFQVPAESTGPRTSSRQADRAQGEARNTPAPSPESRGRR